ncbi:lactonase family protein [uncultured Flavobacterium sp.]|uniref:lactonase family protein n=1 Tax=uncultured Flavobacterium sp. TaxID=165435 RepID=UPI0030EF10F3
MKNHFLLFLVLLFFLSCSSTKKQSFLVGTYTENNSQGINYIDFDVKTNKISVNAVIYDVKNPSFVISNKAKTVVIAVEEFPSKSGGKVTSFAFDATTKNFQKINSVDTFGDDPCYVSLSPNEKFIVVGNYSSGNYTVFPMDENGKIGEKVLLIQHEGKSVNRDRQRGPHVHSVVFHPTENKLFFTDLGNDTVEIVPFNQNNTSLVETENAFAYHTIPGKGPRHIVFDKTGNYMFITFELTNEVGIAKYENNKLELLQTILLTDIPTLNGSAAEVRLSEDGNFLYASVRGMDNVLVVLQKQKEGSWKEIQTVSTGLVPRNFILTNNDQKILVANQDSNSIWIFDRDTKTGLLTKTQEEFSIHKPVYFWSF